MKKILFFIGMGIMSLAIAESAQAAAIGVYGTGGVNFSTWKYRDASASTTDALYGCGVVFDTNAAKNELFGYRLTAGYEQYRLKYTESDQSSDPIHRVSMSHTFGFGMVRTDLIRFWAGPRIGLHYLNYRNSYTTIRINVIPPMIYPKKIKVKLDMIGFDLLLAFGFNFNIGNMATIFLDLGFGYMGNYNIHETQKGHGFGLDGKIGFMFRINDKYKG